MHHINEKRVKMAVSPNLVEPSAQHLGYTAIILANLLYGGNIIVARLLAPTSPPLALSAARGILGLLILLPLIWRTPNKPARRDLPYMAMLGLLGISIAYTTLAWSMQTSPASNAAIIFASAPAVNHVLLAVGWRIKPRRHQIMGVILAFSGLVLVTCQGSLERMLMLRFQPVDLIILTNVTAVCLYNIFGQKIMNRPGGYTPLVTSAYALLFGTLILLPGGCWEIVNRGWRLSAADWLMLFYMGCIIAGVAVMLNLLAVSRIGCTAVAMFNNLAPMFTIILSALILHESLYWYHGAGFVLVLSGVTLSLLPHSPNAVNKNGTTLQQPSKLHEI